MCENCPDSNPKTFCTTCYRDKSCDVKINAACVYYHLYDDEASNLNCLGIPNKISLEAILDEIDDKLCDFTAMQTPLTVVDTNSINLTANGTANHTLQADIRLDPDSSNTLSISSAGLLGTGGSGNLTFNNALTKTSSNVQLGGPLVKTTTIDLSTFTLNLNGAVSLNHFNKDSVLFYNEVGSTCSSFSQANNFVNIEIADKTEYNSGLGFHSYGFFDVRPYRALIGYACPTTNNGNNPQPPEDPLKTSYFTGLPRTAALYGNQIVFTSPTNSITSGTIVSGVFYEILSVAGGADFTNVGAATNTVGLIFLSTGTAPTSWGSGSLRLFGRVKSDVRGQNGDYANFDNTSRGFNITAYNTATDSYVVCVNTPQLWEAQLRALNGGVSSYYAKGQISINDGNFVKIGHATPTANGLVTPAPANDQALTTHTIYSDGLIVHYGKDLHFEGSALFKGQDIGGATVASAALEVRSTTQGFLPPKMTRSQRLAISAPEEGLMVYQTDTTSGQVKGLWIFDGSVWRRLSWV